MKPIVIAVLFSVVTTPALALSFTFDDTNAVAMRDIQDRKDGFDLPPRGADKRDGR